MAPWHAILRAIPFTTSSPRAQGDILSPSELRYLLPAMRNPCAAKSDSALAIRSSGRRGGTPGALAHMVAANLRAGALAPVIQELRAAGFVSYGAVARELNRRQVPPPSWRQAVVSDDRKQGAGTSGKAEVLIRIRETNDTGRQIALGQR
jgi:hypothetical protein